MTKKNRNGAVDALKLIAVAAMVIDHSRFIAGEYADIVMIIGRMAFPIFAFVVAFNLFSIYEKGANEKVVRYSLNLAVFAVISAIPHYLFIAMGNGLIMMNIMFTLFAGLILTILYKSENRLILRGFVLPMFALGLALCSSTFEYGIFGVLIVPTMFIMLEVKRFWLKLLLLLAGVGLAIISNAQYMMGTIERYGIISWQITPMLVSAALAVVICFLATQTKGVKLKAPAMGKWMYWFYPGHLLFFVLIS